MAIDIQQLAASLAGASQAPIDYGANINDTAAVAPMTANIRNLSSLFGQGDIAARATGSLGAAAGEQADQEDAAAKLAAQQAAADAKANQDEIDRLSNPDNYKSIINDVGGYDFFDPDGNKISAVQYARKKNMQLTDVYKNSEDPNDKDFLDDYNAVTELGKIVQSGDAKARDKFYEQHPDIKEAYGNATYDEIVNDFRDHYPGYFRSADQYSQSGIADKRASDIQPPEAPDTRGAVKKTIDQLLPSLFGIGNTSTAETQRTSARSKKKKK